MSAICLDVGTTMIKAVGYDDAGAVVVTVREPTAVRSPHPGWSEQDMGEVWDAVVRGVRGVVAEIGGDVAYVAVTAQGDGCWLVDAHGEPTGPAILWNDARAAGIVDGWARAGVLDRAYPISRSTTFPGLSNAILAWLGEHEPQRAERAERALTCGGWVFSRLTGRLVLDSSDACVPFMDPVARQYSDDLFTLYGLEWARRLLPDPLDDDARAVPLTDRAAAELGVAPGTPAVLAPYDIASTAIGVGAVSAGQACTILGTTLCTEVVATDPREGEAYAYGGAYGAAGEGAGEGHARRGETGGDVGRDASGQAGGFTVPLGLPGRYLHAFPTLAGTGVLDWACAVLGLGSARELVELADGVAPGADGLVFLPYLSPAGERAPFVDSRARGSFLGLTSEHGRAHLARAVLEGLSLVIRDCLTASGVTPIELRVAGGGSASPVWLRMLADVTGVPVVRSVDDEAGARGAFLVGRLATGVATDSARDAEAYVRVRDVVEPDAGRSRTYAGLYENFLDLRGTVSTTWGRLAGSRVPDTGAR